MPALPSQWDGFYLDGRTAARRPVVVIPMCTGLQLLFQGAEARLWPYTELRQTQGFYARESVRFERGDALPEVVVVADARLLLAMRRVAPLAAARFHNPARRRLRGRLTLLAVLGVVLLLAGLYLWGIPALATLAADRVPVRWEDRLGTTILEQLAPPATRCADPAGLRALDALIGRLAATQPDIPYRFQITVVRSPIANAFAAPGGHLLLLEGLLARTRTPEELAGVLAHEMQHVLHRHATRAIIQQASSGLLLTALTGDASGALAYGLEGARTLGMLEYSRQHEEEADREGLRMLLAARIDPRGFLRFLEETRKTDGPGRSVPRYLSTHPDTTDRLSRLRALLPAGAAPYPPPLDPETWDTLRKVCGTAPRPQ